VSGAASSPLETERASAFRGLGGRSGLQMESHSSRGLESMQEIGRFLRVRRGGEDGAAIPLRRLAE
jgi:hypothetical protein